MKIVSSVGYDDEDMLFAEGKRLAGVAGARAKELAQKLAQALLSSGACKPREELCVLGKVRIGIWGGLPLQDVKVSLWRWDTNLAEESLVEEDVTDEYGRYKICSPDISVPSPDLFYLTVVLAENRNGRLNDFGIQIVDLSVSAFNKEFAFPLEVGFGEGGRMGITYDADDPSAYFEILGEGDLNRDLSIQYTEDNPETNYTRENHVLEGALVYYHTHQAMRFYRDVLGVNMDDWDPLRVWIYNGPGDDAWTDGDGIWMDDEASVWNDGNAPKNREYHEYSHWAMFNSMGWDFPLWAEPTGTDFNKNGWIDIDENHGGYWFNELSSSDAWVEGFAEFMALAIADHYQNVEPEIFFQYFLPNYIYTVADGPYPQLYNLELNYKPTWDEEYLVASVLWDLYDPVNEEDHDPVSMSIEEIWWIISRVDHTLPSYYLPGYYYTTGEIELLEFLGDEYVYPYSPYREMPRDEGYPVGERPIWYVKDLYDVLVGAVGPSGKKVIDEIFRAHDEYMNTYAVYDDYSSTDNMITIGDTGSTIRLETSPDAAHQFWSRGIVAYVDNAGWGSGFLIDKAVNPAGFPFLAVWVDAPPGTEMSIVLEGPSGEWISPIVSKEEGWAGAYVVTPAVSQEEEDQRFKPNPYHNTPTAYELDATAIRKIGLLFHTPGTYEVKVGPIVFMRGYPWKLGMHTIYGIGDPSLAPHRPYRRHTPPIEGATVMLELDDVPATLEVQMKYAPPYEELGFTYNLNLTETISVVGLYLEPSENGADNEAILTISKGGAQYGEPIKINSTYFWNNLGEKEHILEVEAEIYTFKPRLPGWFTRWFPFLIPLSETLLPIIPMPYTPYAALALPLIISISLISAGMVLLSRKKRKKKGMKPLLSPTSIPSLSKYCTHCGEKIPSNAIYCLKCGKKQSS